MHLTHPQVTHARGEEEKEEEKRIRPPTSVEEKIARTLLIPESGDIRLDT